MIRAETSAAYFFAIPLVMVLVGTIGHIIRSDYPGVLQGALMSLLMVLIGLRVFLRREILLVTPDEIQVYRGKAVDEHYSLRGVQRARLKRLSFYLESDADTVRFSSLFLGSSGRRLQALRAIESAIEAMKTRSNGEPSTD